MEKVNFLFDPQVLSNASSATRMPSWGCWAIASAIQRGKMEGDNG